MGNLAYINKTHLVNKTRSHIILKVKSLKYVFLIKTPLYIPMFPKYIFNLTTTLENGGRFLLVKFYNLEKKVDSPIHNFSVKLIILNINQLPMWLTSTFYINNNISSLYNDENNL